MNVCICAAAERVHGACFPCHNCCSFLSTSLLHLYRTSRYWHWMEFFTARLKTQSHLSDIKSTFEGHCLLIHFKKILCPYVVVMTLRISARLEFFGSRSASYRYPTIAITARHTTNQPLPLPKIRVEPQQRRS